MSGRIDFTLDFNTRNSAFKKDRSSGYRIYLLGNFSGCSDVPWPQRNIKAVDVDNFDQVMTEISPVLEIDSGHTFRFESLDDFHPDAWFEKIPILAELQALKRELGNPNTAAQAAARIKSFCQPNENRENFEQTPQVTESKDDMLQRLLGKKPETAAGAADTVEMLIDRVVSPYITQTAEPQHLALIDVIDATMGRFLRTLLHRPDFQSLEALWRATEALIDVEYSDRQRFFLVDVSQAELSAELCNGSRLFEGKLLQHVQDGDDDQDVLLIGDYRFSDGDADKELLSFMSGLAKTVQGYFFGGAERALVDCFVGGHTEQRARYLDEIDADNAILAHPRFLLRRPYCNKSDPIEAFAFEECGEIPESNELLWGNPAFLCTRVLIGASLEEPFFMSDVPAFSFIRDGEPVLQPGTETVLNEAEVNAQLSQGITPLIGFRQRQGVRVAAITALSGRVFT